MSSQKCKKLIIHRKYLETILIIKSNNKTLTL